MSILTDYITVAKSTAQPEAYSYEYLVPALLGEVGEVFGQIAKAKWHGWSHEKLTTELVAEYGDICWMTAILIDHRLDIDTYDLKVGAAPVAFFPYAGIRHIQVHAQNLVEAYEIEQSAGETINRFCEEHGMGVDDTGFHELADRYDAAQDTTDELLLKLWAYLEVHAAQVTGSEISVALAYNAEKLASRAERGVLRGAGDHR